MNASASASVAVEIVEDQRTQAADVELVPSAAGVSEALSYAVCEGILMASPTPEAPHALTHAPLTYWPSDFPRTCYDEAIKLTRALNRLIHAISSDVDWLRSALASTGDSDKGFTGRLLSMVRRAREDEITLSICRYDYFVQEERLKMVELNTIAASFGCLGSKTAELHSHLSNHPASRPDYELKRCEPRKLPQAAKNAPKGLAKALALAHNQFIKKYPFALPCVAVMVVQPGEKNTADQDMLRHELWKTHNIEMRRMSLLDIHQQAHNNISEDGSTDDNDVYKRILRLKYNNNNGAFISTIYFRAGYDPADYPTEKQWNARQLIESSNVIKVPTIAVQLAGCKKVQQLLDTEGMVEKFVADEVISEAIRGTFARQYALGEADIDILKKVDDMPENYVLKPQREGGGHNLYGEELKSKLLAMDRTERSAYVLMERIRPTVVNNAMIRNGVASPCQVVSELGIYGTLVTVDGTTQIILNEVAGTLLRSKNAKKDDGGVAAGVAVLDSPRLTP